MRVLVIGPPLYGLLYPMVSLAQAFRSAGHEVVVASAEKFAAKAAEAGLVTFDAAPALDSEAAYKRGEEERKRQQLGTRMGRFSFFSEEMADRLVGWVAAWRPDLIIYPPLGVVARLLSAKFDIPAVMQTVGFAHTKKHVEGVTRSLADALERHGVSASPEDLARNDLAWIDVAPPSMSVLDHRDCPVIGMRYVPYNGGAVWQDWWTENPHRPRIVVSLGTLKPMVDGLDLISWVMDSADLIDADFVLGLGRNARAELRSLPDNVRLVDWIPMGPLLGQADGFIHHGGAGNTLSALSAGVPQIVFGEGADRPLNARVVADRGCGFTPAEALDTDMVRRLIEDDSLRRSAAEVAAEMAAQDGPQAVAERLVGQLVRSAA